MSLKNYKEKRDFKKTSEPEGKEQKDKEEYLFVVQKHDASKLHYDLRIQMGGVLKSWAIPKGPTLNPENKRLAIPTEDHPIDYADFEGIIPEDNYGAGAVIVWDKGTYKNKTERDGKLINMEQAYNKGHITLHLNGEKLKGGFSLIKMKQNDKWLFIKKNDSEAKRKGDILKEKPKSVLSGKKLEEMKQENEN